MSKLDSYKRVPVKSAKEWHDWLSKHHGNKESIWLVTHKKGMGPYIPMDELIDEAIAFGWIDSTIRKLDEKRTLRLFSPRKKGSNWSAINKKRVVRLIKEKRMKPSGMKKVQAAKKDGSWKALDKVEKMVVPSDLKTAFRKYKMAKKYFDNFPQSSKRAILEWVNSAKTEPTRKKRVSETAKLADKNLKAFFPKDRNKSRPLPEEKKKK